MLHGVLILAIVLVSNIYLFSGTPGRVKHMISCSALNTRRIKILVLDEVDTMLSRGFEEQVYRVIHTSIYSCNQAKLLLEQNCCIILFQT